MTPAPQENSPSRQDMMTAQQCDGDSVVISGMSGLYPQARNVIEFSDILYNKVNPVTQEGIRYEYNIPEVQKYAGSIPDLECFDAQFFKINFHLAATMDPMSKKMLEHAYQAIYDAGVNPEHLSGKKVGVYVGSAFSETEKAVFYAANVGRGLGIAGCSKTMYANRISYWLNAKGPSMGIDEACCSSAAALEQAYSAINRGECEAAIVGGSYLCLHPQSSVHYGRIIPLCNDGKTKSFDEHADGCAKSEAINVLFLQKAKDALRVYAKVVHVKTEFSTMLTQETGPKYGFCRSVNSTTSFLKQFYEDIKVPPQAVEFVEAFGCATPEADKVELQAIEKVFCENREDQLLVGSVTSNIGYVEAASGIAAVMKVLLGYHNGELAANLHCDTPRQDVAALREGRMRVIVEHERFRRTYVAVNGMSFAGVNSHALLQGLFKPKNLDRYKSSIPHLVTMSGRHDQGVKYALETLKSNPIDPEQLALLHNIHRASISGHLARGFIVLQQNKALETISLSEKVEYFDGAERPLWFVYSGMGSQWAGMGAQLMRIPIFAAAIERCDKVMATKGLNISTIITSPDEATFDNILHSFVGIAAVQIGLTDILLALGLKPDGIIGHSVGELGCAYADGCLSTEEMILSAYYRGLVSLETKFIRGSMAAVGMGYEQISKLVPPEIGVACHNGPESCTISGPSDEMRAFVAELTAKGIFAKEVPCSNIAYHSRYIADAGPGLLKYLKAAIPSPKARSDRWLSTSVPQQRWTEPVAQLCSAEYLTNNLLSPVLFEETSRLIPSNAVLVEVAPHGLLQAILKRSMPPTCINIPLTRRKHPDATLLLLESIGRLYMEGYNSNIDVLYPKVEMPVSTGTPFLSHMVKWAHDEHWPLQLYCTANRNVAATCNFNISLQDKEHAYLKGHLIRGSTLYPFAASLVLVWDTLAMTMNVPRKQLSVTFNDLHLQAQPVLHEQRHLKLYVAIQRGTGRFEVLDDCSKVMTGFINPLKHEMYSLQHEENVKMFYNAEDVYQLLHDRDYSYRGEFRTIKGVDECLSNAQVEWRDNWVTFIDGLLQLNALRQAHSAVSLPTRIRSMLIDVKQHYNVIRSKSDKVVLFNAQVNNALDYTRCDGIIIQNIRFKNLAPVNAIKLSLKTLAYVSNFQSKLDVSASLDVYLQIVAENVNKEVITVVGIESEMNKESYFKDIDRLLNNVFGVKVNYRQITRETALQHLDYSNVDLVLTQNLSTDKCIRENLNQVLSRDQFVVVKEHAKHAKLSQASPHYRVLSAHSLASDREADYSELRLIRWGATPAHTPTKTVTVHTEADFKLLAAVRASLNSECRLLVMTPYPAYPELKELVAAWRKEAVQNKIHLISVRNCCVDDVKVNSAEVELAFNVVDDNNWGGEYYLPTVNAVTVSKNVMLESVQLGDRDSINWVAAPKLTGSGVTVTVHYAGLNSNDIKRASNALDIVQNSGSGYGSDFSGVTARGERVMGIAANGAASTQVRARPPLLWPVPAHWSLEDAATVPLAYAQAFYILGVKAELSRGMTVLVHGGAGALGQAAISILLAHGCQVFTTVSDINKKYFLLKLFPALKADHIASSRDDSFADMVLTTTKRKGCDVIISCVKGNLKNATLRCNGFLGTCYDVSQLYNEENFEFGMHHLHLFQKYCTVDFSSIFLNENVDQVKAISEMVSAGIARGYVRPLSRVTYEPCDAARALRLLARSQHRGRVLLRVEHASLQAQHSILAHAENYHLLFCNKAHFGLWLADRLVVRGVKKIFLYVLTQSAYVQYKIRFWRSLGVDVHVFTGDLTVQTISTIITESSRLGTIEGVYVTVRDEDDIITETHIKDLDDGLRIHCREIKYFAIYNVGGRSIGKKVCGQRIHDQLPATMLTLPDLEREFLNERVSVRDAVDAAENALQGWHGILVANPARATRPTLLQALATLAEVDIPENVEKSLTLQDLGIQDHKLQAICKFLQVQHNIVFDEQQVSLLTVHAIMELEKQIFKLPYDDIKGLQTFFSHVGSDELLATAELVFLPTLLNRAAMRDDEYMSDKQYLCIVPGMEGHHERFRVLCERLKLPALVLQPGLDHPHETVTETAQRFVEVLMRRTEMKNNFYLLGYESGIFVALEIAAILEEHGLTGTVFCVGCSPEELRSEINEQLADFETDEQLQDGVLRHMYTLMAGAGNNTALLDDAVRNVPSWPQRVEACVRVLLGCGSHSAQYARSLIDCALARLHTARRASVAIRPLRSQLVLLRAAQGPPQYSALQRLSLQPLVVYQLDTTLAHVATDLRCATIINEHLDPAILDEFSASNICDTYLINGNIYMSSSRADSRKQ